MMVDGKLCLVNKCPGINFSWSDPAGITYCDGKSLTPSDLSLGH